MYHRNVNYLCVFSTALRDPVPPLSNTAWGESGRGRIISDMQHILESFSKQLRNSRRAYKNVRWIPGLLDNSHSSYTHLVPVTRNQPWQMDDREMSMESEKEHVNPIKDSKVKSGCGLPPVALTGLDELRLVDVGRGLFLSQAQ